MHRTRPVLMQPPPLLELFHAATPRGHQDDPNSYKLCRRNALSGSGSVPDNNKSLITNPDKNPVWILSDKEGYTRTFPRAIWKENPPPKMNESDKYCCPCLNGRGYCFENCNRSHEKMSPVTARKYDGWQKKCRASAK